MSKNILAEDTVIQIGKSIPLSKYRDFFVATTGEELPSAEFQPWLNLQAGKTLRDALAEYGRAVQRKPVKALMAEERFADISDVDKAFIIAFDEGIGALGFDCGGGIGDGYCWGKYMIVYAQTGVKAKKVAARIFIRENSIVLRLFFNGIDKHIAYIQDAPEHIKAVFAGDEGNCGCNPKKENCRMRKTYTIDGKQMEKCSGVVFEFYNPTMEKLGDYMGLLAEFYPAKKA